jgi:predicted nicotinamide N-methyase
MLALPWRKYSPDDFYIRSTKIKINETSNDSSGTGLIVWDGSFVLGKFLEFHFKSLKGKAVIELGSGTGLAGICASVLDAYPVFLTDLDYVLENLRRNVEMNVKVGNVICEELDWFHYGDFGFLQGVKPDLILLADVAWVTSLVEPLVNTIEALWQYCKPTVPQIFLAHQTRALKTDEELFSEFAKFGFVVRRLKLEDYHPDYTAVDLYEILKV